MGHKKVSLNLSAGWSTHERKGGEIGVSYQVPYLPKATFPNALIIAGFINFKLDVTELHVQNVVKKL
jgi:hypothetical protein